MHVAYFQGTCFTSAENVVENYPSSIDSIRVWLNMNEDESPGYSVSLKGSSAAERKGVIWALRLVSFSHFLGFIAGQINLSFVMLPKVSKIILWVCWKKISIEFQRER